VYEHAARLRASGLFDEVAEAFWKEEPSLRDALSLLESDDIWVVPFFLAEGYFTRTVVPRELGLNDPHWLPPEKRVFYCSPVGAHPAMPDLVLRRALDLTHARSFAPEETALIIIGHGTSRSRTSGDTVYQLVETLRARDRFARVECGFLDEAPTISEVLETVTARNVVLVPFFMAEGWHAGATIPADLELTGEQTRRGEQTIWYAPPVGTLPDVADLVLLAVQDAILTAGNEPGIAEAARPGEPSPMDIRSARRSFLAWVDEAGPDGRSFLQIHLRRDVEGGYRVVHRSDRDRLPEQLAQVDGPEAILDVVRTSAAGEYRPLRFAPTLRDGWELNSLDATGLWRAVSLLYPAAALFRALGDAGAVTVTSWEDWAARQTGIYERLGELDAETLDEVVQQCCGSCLRSRFWRARHEPVPPVPDSGDILSSRELPGSGRQPLIVPCPEPCTWFGSLARESLDRKPLRGTLIVVDRD
jgi:sirohydrochlorin cobaltochelatase